MGHRNHLPGNASTSMNFRSLPKSLLVLAAASVLAWISMHLLLVCLGLSITAGELEGRVSQDYLSALNHGIGLTLLATLVIQVLNAWALMHVWPEPVRRLRPTMWFCAGLLLSMTCTALLVFASLFTGGGLVAPSLEHGLKSMVRTS
jgi:hypothetical protein